MLFVFFVTVSEFNDSWSEFDYSGGHILCSQENSNMKTQKNKHLNKAAQAINAAMQFILSNEQIKVTTIQL